MKKKIISSVSDDYVVIFTLDSTFENFEILDSILNLREYYDFVDANAKYYFNFGLFNFVYEFEDKKVPVLLNFTPEKIEFVIIKNENFEFLLNKFLEKFEFKPK